MKRQIFTFLGIISLSSLYAYDWPIYPFSSQHKITSTLGEYRPTYVDAQGDTHSMHFHKGVDIAEPYNTAVYPVVDDTIDKIKRRSIYTKRGFKYYHIIPNPDTSIITINKPIYAGQTILGWIDEANHLHFEERKPGCIRPIYNPLRCNSDTGLYPFVDNGKPEIFAIEFRQSDYGDTVYRKDLSGEIDIVVHAGDPRVDENGYPFEWPAHQCGVYKIGVEVLKGTTPKYQNWIVFDNVPDKDALPFVYDTIKSDWSKYYYFVTNKPFNPYGNYNSAWNTESIDDGRYTLRIIAADIRNNADTVEIPVIIDNWSPWMQVIYWIWKYGFRVWFSEEMGPSACDPNNYRIFPCAYKGEVKIDTIILHIDTVKYYIYTDNDSIFCVDLWYEYEFKLETPLKDTDYILICRNVYDLAGNECIDTIKFRGNPRIFELWAFRFKEIAGDGDLIPERAESLCIHAGIINKSSETAYVSGELNVAEGYENFIKINDQFSSYYYGELAPESVKFNVSPFKTLIRDTFLPQKLGFKFKIYSNTKLEPESIKVFLPTNRIISFGKMSVPLAESIIIRPGYIDDYGYVYFLKPILKNNASERISGVLANLSVDSGDAEVIPWADRVIYDTIGAGKSDTCINSFFILDWDGWSPIILHLNVCYNLHDTTFWEMMKFRLGEIEEGDEEEEG